MNDDLISRQEAIDAMAKHFGTDAELLKGCDINTFWNPAHVLFVLEDLPSAEPKKGKWIWKGEEGDSRFMCSECKCKEYVPTCNGIPDIWNYCPNCGAKMESD